MTTKEQVQRESKSNGLRVFKTADDQYYVESSEGKIAYRVSGSNGSKSCSCGDYTNKIEKDPSFQCKHILAVINGNGNIRNVEIIKTEKPKLDESFIKKIDDKDFVLYSGLLDVAHQKNLNSVDVELIQFPSDENKQTAICRAKVETVDGKKFSDIGDANPQNCNSKVARHLIRMASTRAKARAFRDMDNIGMTALEELGDLNEAMEDESGKSRTRPRREAKAETVNTEKKIQAPQKQELQKGGSGSDEQRSKTNQQTKKEPVKTTGVNTSEKKEDKKTADTKGEEGKINPSEAQIKAIEKLAERRGINGEQIVKIFTDKYKKPYEQINANEAKEFIRHLQQAA